MKSLTCLSFLTLFAATTLHAQNGRTPNSRDTNKITEPDVKNLSERDSVLNKEERLKKPESRQSAFYDAIAIYYLSQNYRVYPESLDSDLGDMDESPAAGDSGAGSNPGLGNGVPGSNPGLGNGVPGSNPGLGDRQRSGRKNPADSVKRGGPDAGDVFALPETDDGLPEHKFKAGKYRLRECISQKIVVDAVSGELSTILEAYTIDPGMAADFMQIILSRYNNPLNISSFTMQTIAPWDFGLNAVWGGLSDRGGAGPTTKILQGMADWAIEAVNREIQEAVFVRLKKLLEKIPELRILFPESLETLSTIEVTNYNNSLNAFKRSFGEDFANLSGNFVDLSSVPRYQHILSKYPLTSLIFAGADVYHKVKANTLSSAEIIHGIGVSGYLDKTGAGITKSTLQLAAIMSDAFRDIRLNDGVDMQKKNDWVPIEKLRVLIENKGIYQIFIRLLQDRIGSISMNGQSIAALLDDTESPAVVNLIQRTSEFKRSINEIRGIDSSASFSDRVGLYVTLMDKTIDLSKLVLDLIPANNTILRLRDVVDGIKETGLPLVRSSANVAVHIKAKDYSGAVYAVDTLLSLLENAFAIGTTDQKDMEIVHSNLIHYGLFIANVAEAKTATDVKSAINSIALPTGSSRIKKENSFSVGINAYAGFAHSWNKQYPDVTLRKNENLLTVPFGISVNAGHFANGSLSLYGGVLDLGAIFSYRVNNATNDIESDIRFDQVLSPSVMLIYGLPVLKGYNIPVSIGAGFQWGPRLRKVNDVDGNSLLPLLTRRFQVFAAIDLPVINFHVSRKYDRVKRN